MVNGKATIAEPDTQRPIDIYVGAISDDYKNNSFELLEIH